MHANGFWGIPQLCTAEWCEIIAGGCASLENAPLAPGYFPPRLRRDSHLDGGELMKMPKESRHWLAMSAQWHSHFLTTLPTYD